MATPKGLPDHILILGDEARSVRSIQRMLISGGYQTTILHSFREARSKIETETVSMVILLLSASRIAPHSIQPADESEESLRRQGWAGEALAFCRATRADDTGGDMPILVISKSQLAQDKVAVLNTGATDYITRPYQRAELLSRVKVHLRSWRYEREITDRFEELNLLHAVSSVLASSLEPEVLLRGTLSVLVKTMRAIAGAVFLRQTSDEAVSIVAVEGFEPAADGQEALLGVYRKTEEATEGRPLLLEPLPEGYLGESLKNIEAHGLLCAPLGLKGNRLGSIHLFSGEESPFPNRLADLLSTICNQLSVALENARLYVETKKSAAQLSFVYNLGNNLMTSLEMDELLGYAVFTVGKSLETDVCAVVVRASDEIEKVASAIYTKSRNEHTGSTSSWCDVDRVLDYLENSSTDLRMSLEKRTGDRFLRDEMIAEETIVPLMFDEVILGVLVCASFSPHPFSDDEHKLLGAVAQQLSLGIRNTELFQRTKDTSINLAVEVARRTREIEEQKRFTEKIIDSMPLSVHVVDRDMRIVAWNRNSEASGLGINRDEAIGRNVFHVFYNQPRRVLEDEFLHVFRTGEFIRTEQESRVDSQIKYWRVNKIPMRVDNAEVTHVITVGEDITEQKKMNDAVIHAEKLASIGRLAAGVVHELNNPLATIAACSEALNARLVDIKDEELNRDFSEYLQIIRDEAFRCKTITNRLLDFSHQRQAEKASSDINQIISQTLQLIKHHPKLGKMNIIEEMEPDLPLVYVNEGQMKQIFIALISNAFDAMDEDGTLTIRTLNVERKNTVSIEFMDTGCGIPNANLTKIFDPFFTTKPLGRGTGLGLSVCYGIVSEHGGKIEVESSEGKGSLFRVLLPILSDTTDSSRKTPEMEKAL